MTYPIHPLCRLFPELAGDDLRELAYDIREHGLLEPIWLYHGEVLDGRGRQAACRLAGVQPRYRDWEGPGSPLDFVVSLNLHRRHLTTVQRAMIGARLVELYAAEAKARQKAGGLAPAGAKGKAAEKAAEALGVPARTVERAKKVLDLGTPELAAAVQAGRTSLTAAAKLADLPPAKQLAEINRAKARIRKQARKDARKEHLDAASRALRKAIQHLEALGGDGGEPALGLASQALAAAEQL